MKEIRWRLSFVWALTILSIYGLTSTWVYMKLPEDQRNDQEVLKEKIPTWMPRSHLNLGLDLQGGVQLVLGINLQQAVENRLGRLATEFVRLSEEGNLSVKNAFVIKNQSSMQVELKEGADYDKFRQEYVRELGGLEQVSREGNFINFNYTQDQIKAIKASAVEQVERVVRSRVDKWGVTEPIINRRADNTVLAQLPGFKDPEKAKELLGRTAQLKFKIVDDEFTGFGALTTALPPGITSEPRANSKQTVLVSEDREAITKFVEGKYPPDRELLFSREVLAGNNKYRYKTLIVHAATELTGDDVLDAGVSMDSNGFENQPAVSLRFTGIGGKRFADITGANVGKHMAIVLDDIVESDPVINQKITGGNAQITLGGFRGYNAIMEEANQLSLVLRSGALPASIEILEQRQVGASLGPELARQGIMGTVLGLILVFSFMMIYYRRPGLIATAALVLNGVFMLAMMASFGFALTLPGIAGFVLSLGMAVDANVLINERIRQEIREGKASKRAVDNGFQKVFWTVFDGHVTTLLGAVILLSTNTSGPIRGFAVTLIIGLVISLFTSLYCSHLFFDWTLAKVRDENSVRKWIGAAGALKHRPFHFNFLKLDLTATGVALLLALTVLVVGVSKGFNWSVDFVGGAEMEVEFAQSVNPTDLRAAASKAGIEDLSIQALKGSDREYLLRFEDHVAKDSQAAPQGSARIQTLQERINQDLAASGPKISRVDYVGPQVGRELRNQGFVSMFYVILGILIYLGLRFDMRFGSAAVLKLIPDTCAMLGFYLFFWRSFDLTSVAALLTGIGYSVNDVIVVFDRIRENLKLHPARSMRDNINISLNETLSRTINTSLVTSLSLVGIIVFGTGAIWNFAVAMAIGIVAATLSSNLVGSSYLLWVDKVWKKRAPRTARSTPAPATSR